MNLLVDTSVWSLALRRDGDGETGPVRRLARALRDREGVFTTGLILQELLQGFRGPKDRRAILERFDALPLLMPDRDDHVEAAALRNACRRRGLPVGTIDALIARLAIRYDLEVLTTDRDFHRIADSTALRVWGAGGA